MGNIIAATIGTTIGTSIGTGSIGTGSIAAHCGVLTFDSN